jgi:hypothetical protein
MVDSVPYITITRTSVEYKTVYTMHLRIFLHANITVNCTTSSKLALDAIVQCLQTGDKYVDAERQEWEPVPEQWDSTIKHFWQARHVKVVEIAVTACGIPVSHTKFPFSEGTNEIVRFMNDTWPSSHPESRPSFLAIDKGCQVMSTLDVNGELIGNGGWMETTRLKVDPWHYNGHQIDALCVNFCNPTDRRDPNLVQLLQEGNHREPQNADGHGRRAIGRRAADVNTERFRRLFNFEASEHLNAWLEPFSATMTKMRPENHDIFLCIILRERANQVKSNSTPL